MIQPLFSSQTPLRRRDVPLRSPLLEPQLSPVYVKDELHLTASKERAYNALRRALNGITLEIEEVPSIPQDENLFKALSPFKRNGSDSSLRSKSHDKSRSGGHSEFKRTHSCTSLNGANQSVSLSTHGVTARKVRRQKKAAKFSFPPESEPEEQSKKTRVTYRSQVSPGSPKRDYFEASIRDALEEAKLKRSGSESSHERFIFMDDVHERQ